MIERLLKSNFECILYTFKMLKDKNENTQLFI